MIGLESLKAALRSLGSNKLRTALTMLGIIIGVGAVIAMLAIGEGAQQSITASISALGTNLITIVPGNQKVRGPGQSATTTLLPADSDAILHNLAKTVAKVAPTARGSVTVKIGDKNSTTSCTGTVPEYAETNNTTVSKGRFISKNDVSGRLKVADVGTTVITNVFGSPTADVVGKYIELNHIRFKIVGVLTSKGISGFGQDQDDIAIIPLSTALRRIFNQTYLSSINVEAASSKPVEMDLVSEQITSLLRRRHHLLPPFPDNDDFSVRNQSALLATSQNVSGTMTALLGGVAVVSLIVGGIGIMNIMIVSVTERTREIGIRKAVGATGRDIMLQFLAESLVVSVLGGVIGIGLGYLISKIVGMTLGWTTLVRPQAVIMSFFVAAGIGIFFGIYPAKKAAELHPIDALRWE
jgi:putative ABC transport system permease protein